MPPYDMGTWARALLDHAYDEEADYCPESYTLSVQDLEKDLEKDLSPKTMKRWVNHHNKCKDSLNTNISHSYKQTHWNIDIMSM